jgi:hypothetical protein
MVITMNFLVDLHNYTYTDVMVTGGNIHRILVVDQENHLVQTANSFEDVDPYYFDDEKYDYILCGKDGSNHRVDAIKSLDEAEYKILA